jgi:hypothetical protein
MIKRNLTAFFLLAGFVLSVDGFAQNPPTPAPSPDTANPQDQSKDKKKKKKDKPAQDPLDAEVFSDAISQSILNDLRDGLEGHSQRLMLSAFDGDKMNGYLQFEDQIEAMFQKYSMFTVHFRIAQSSVEGPKGIVLVDFQMEETPSGSNPSPVRKSSQVRIELERGRKGWKIVDINPRSFFS